MLAFGGPDKDNMPHIRKVGIKKQMIWSQIEEDLRPPPLDGCLAGDVKGRVDHGPGSSSICQLTSLVPEEGVDEKETTKPGKFAHLTCFVIKLYDS